MKPTLVLAVLAIVCAAAPASTQTPPAALPPLPYTAVHNPAFVPAAKAAFLQDDDILLGVASGKVAKAYPAGDLAQHGAVFDTMPDGPISITWCGACNTGIVFRADVKGRTLHFEFDRMVGGNEVQKDIETGTSWQQATGEAIEGPLKGTRLTLYPAVRTTWAEWRKQHPHTLVLQPLPGYAERLRLHSQRIRDVSRVGLEGTARGARILDSRLPPRETIAGFEVGGDAVAFPFTQLRLARVVNERVGGQPLLIVHQPASDTTTAFDPRVKGRALRFDAANAGATAVIDRETRSTWNAYGLAVDGPLKGTQLQVVIPIAQFWFAWSQFRPATRVFTAGGIKASPPTRATAWQRLSRQEEVTLLRITLAPGARSDPYGDDGRGLVYVLEGRVETVVSSAPRTLAAGDTLATPGVGPVLTFRNTSRNASATLLLYHTGPERP